MPATSSPTSAIDLAKRKIKVYVAGPYSKPDPCVNTHVAINLWNRLWDTGYAPFCPHLTHFLHTLRPRPYPEWLAYDNEWLRACDVVLRYGGASSGADAEVALAGDLGIPVVRSVHELERWAEGNISPDLISPYDLEEYR